MVICPRVWIKKAYDHIFVFLTNRAVSILPIIDSQAKKSMWGKISTIILNIYIYYIFAWLRSEFEFERPEREFSGITCELQDFALLIYESIEVV